MMLPKICLLAPAVVLALGFVATGALAHQPTRHGEHQKVARTIADARPMARHHHDLVRHDRWVPAGVYSGYPRFERPGYAGPGYVFVPGKGILGQDCDMPTSTCPNEVRDTQ